MPLDINQFKIFQLMLQILLTELNILNSKKMKIKFALDLKGSIKSNQIIAFSFKKYYKWIF